MPGGSLLIASQMGARTLVGTHSLGLGDAVTFLDHVAIT